MWKKCFWGMLCTGALLFGNACGTSEEVLDVDEDYTEGPNGKVDVISTKVKVSTDKTEYTLGDSVKVTLKNSYKTNAIFLEGCNPLLVEQNTGVTWEMSDLIVLCVWEGNAVKVKAGKSFTKSFTPTQAGTYRVTALFKNGCKDGKPLSSCQSITQYAPVISATFTVGQPEKCHPVCLNKGTRSEGWYDSCTKRLVGWAQCAGCEAKCDAIGSRSEGWYSVGPTGPTAACTQAGKNGSGLIYWDQCADTTDPKTCGPYPGGACDADEFCNFEMETCDAMGGSGTCVTLPQACIQNWAPVCGCDGITYSNDCHRIMARARLAHAGEC